MTEELANVFATIGSEYIGRTPPEVDNILRFVNANKVHLASNLQCFRSYFGTSPVICAILWQMIVDAEPLKRGAMKGHLLWALVFLKVYANKSALCALVGLPNKKTFCKWTKYMINQISWLKSDVASLIINCFCCYACCLLTSHCWPFARSCWRTDLPMTKEMII